MQVSLSSYLGHWRVMVTKAGPQFLQIAMLAAERLLQDSAFRLTCREDRVLIFTSNQAACLCLPG